MSYTDSATPPVEAFLAHYGVKGMKWGVRRGKEKSSEPKTKRTPEERKALAKKLAVGTGVLIAAAGAAYLAKNGKLGEISLSSIKVSAETKRAASGVLKEQADVLHASRGKNKGFTFLKTGGLDNVLTEFESIFGVDNNNEGFKRLPDGRVAASFMDPKGRSDFAGRLIPHQVIVPKTMAEGLNSIDDVKAKIWPILEPSHDALYESDLEGRR